MKNKKLLYGLTALSAIAISASAASGVLAAGNGNYNSKMHKGNKQPITLTAAQKADMQAKQAAVKAALVAGDYNAWVTAEKAVNTNSPMPTKITATNFADYAKKFQDREAQMTQVKAKQTAIKAALTAGDYTAWVTAEKAVNTNSPMLTKITATNFADYANAVNLRDQADAIFVKLGINEESGESFGPGKGMMGGKGQRGPVWNSAK